MYEVLIDNYWGLENLHVPYYDVLSKTDEIIMFYLVLTRNIVLLQISGNITKSVFSYFSFSWSVFFWLLVLSSFQIVYKKYLILHQQIANFHLKIVKINLRSCKTSEGKHQAIKNNKQNQKRERSSFSAGLKRAILLTK